MQDFTIIDEGASASGRFNCYKIEAPADMIDSLVETINAIGGVRYVDGCKLLNRVTFEATKHRIADIRKAVSAPKRRVVVAGDMTADLMGPGFDGFGKLWRLPEGDSSVYGFSPDLEGSFVKYAYFN